MSDLVPLEQVEQEVEGAVEDVEFDAVVQVSVLGSRC
jgi:hypothetical protein